MAATHAPAQLRFSAKDRLHHIAERPKPRRGGATRKSLERQKNGFVSRVVINVGVGLSLGGAGPPLEPPPDGSGW